MFIIIPLWSCGGLGVVMKNLFSFWRLFLCVAISLSVVSCTDDKDDADDNRYEVGANCDCADIVALLTNKIEEMEAQLEEYKSEIDSIETQLNIFSGGGKSLSQLENVQYETKKTSDGKAYYDTYSFEYDDNGRMIKVIADYGDGNPDIYNIMYSENKCVVKRVDTGGGYQKFTLALKEDEIDNPQAINYLIIDMIDVLLN